MKIALVGLALAIAAGVTAAPSDEITFTAQSVNVEQPGTPVKIKILRWSTEDEMRPILTALSAPPQQPSDASRANAPAAGRGRAGAAGRGRGRGPAAPLPPIAAFTAALNRVPTVGYIWTNDITGYSIKYAYQTTMADGGERIVLATDRRLGAYTNAWKATTPAPETDYAFTVIELRMGPKGGGEGKMSLTSKIAVEEVVRTIQLENYPAAVTYLSVLSQFPSPK